MSIGFIEKNRLFFKTFPKMKKKTDKTGKRKIQKNRQEMVWNIKLVCDNCLFKRKIHGRKWKKKVNNAECGRFGLEKTTKRRKKREGKRNLKMYIYSDYSGGGRLRSGKASVPHEKSVSGKFPDTPVWFGCFSRKKSVFVWKNYFLIMICLVSLTHSTSAPSASAI